MLFLIVPVLMIFAGLPSGSGQDGIPRLPRDVLPHHYSLRLALAGNQVEGSVEIFLQCVQDADRIVLHASLDTVQLQSVQMRRLSAPVRRLHGFGVSRSDSGLLYIHRIKLRKGANYLLMINFTSQMTNDWDQPGLYTDGRMILSRFQPAGARRIFPCFDEPDFKADFSLALGRPAIAKTFSNMPLVDGIRSNKDSTDDYVWDVFHRSFPMSTYQLALVVIMDGSSMNNMIVGDNNVQLSVYGRPNQMNQIRLLEVGMQLLTFYQFYFGYQFPLPKLDLVVIPQQAKDDHIALENWGLHVYGEQILTNVESGALVMAHELAHSWAGDLVGLRWWTDMWLNEGLAGYLSYLAVEQWSLLRKTSELFEIDELQAALLDDQSLSVRRQDEPGYHKSSSLIRMLASVLGESTFRSALQRYFRSLEYRSAGEEDLWRMMTRQANLDKKLLPTDVQSIMEPWVTQDGYPVVTIERGYNAAVQGIMRATQERFLTREPIADDKEESPSWWIPLTYTSSDFSAPSSRIQWLKKGEESIIIQEDSLQDDQWIIANVDRKGLYRVNYDERNWQLILAQLESDPAGIPVINRAGLIDDALNLARSGRLDYTIALNMVAGYLVNDLTEYLPWKSALKALEYIDSMLAPTLAYPSFRKFAAGILTPIYKNVSSGLSRSMDDDPMRRRLRTDVTRWACHWRVPDCLADSASLFQRWMNNKSADSGAIPTDWRRVVACTAIRELGPEAWESAKNRAIVLDIHDREKSDLLAGMACSTDPSLLSKMLDWTLDTPFAMLTDAGQSVDDIIRPMASASIQGRNLAFNLVRRRNLKLLSRYGASANSDTSRLAHTLVDTVTSSFNTLADLQALKEWMLELEAADSSSVGFITREQLAQQFRLAEANVLWMSICYQPIDQWLQQRTAVERTNLL